MNNRAVLIAALLVAPSVAFSVDLDVGSDFLGFSYSGSGLVVKDSTIRQSGIAGNMVAECDGFNASCANDLASTRSSGDTTITDSEVDQSAIVGNATAKCSGINCTATNSVASMRAGR